MSRFYLEEDIKANVPSIRWSLKDALIQMPDVYGSDEETAKKLHEVDKLILRESGKKSVYSAGMVRAEDALEELKDAEERLSELLPESSKDGAKVVVRRLPPNVSAYKGRAICVALLFVRKQGAWFLHSIDSQEMSSCSHYKFGRSSYLFLNERQKEAMLRKLRGENIFVAA